MPKQPDGINCTDCPLLKAQKKEADRAFKEAGMTVLDFQNEIDWLKQRIDELEDEIFILKDCEPAISHIPDRGNLF